MKKCLALLLAAGLMLSLSGCCLTIPGALSGQMVAPGVDSNADSNVTDTIVVPNFAGMHIDEISNNAEYMANFIFETVNQEYSEQPVGTVLRQSLEPGLHVKKGTKTIVLTVSKGPRMVQIPNVVGMSKEAAQAMLENVGFSVAWIYEYSENVDKGHVIAVQPAEYPTELIYGSELTLVVCSGGSQVSDSVAVPNVIGRSEDQASDMLAENNFVVLKTYKNTSEAPAGTVIAQSVIGTAMPGTSVMLTISRGYVDVKLQIQLPDSSMAVDIWIFVDGVLYEMETDVIPNNARVLTITLSEMKESYAVHVKIAKAGAPSTDSYLYAEYRINGCTGKIVEVLRDEDVLKKYETEVL